MEGPRGKTWPRPPSLCGISSLSQAMGLSRTDPTFNNFTSGMRSLSSRFLDQTVSIRDQDRGQWTKFSNAALDMFPYLGVEFQDAWPMEAYIRKWLDRMRWEHNQKKKNHAAKDQQTEGRPDEGGHSVDRLELPRKSSRIAGVRCPYNSQSRKVLPASQASSSSSSSESTRRSSTPVDLSAPVVQEPQSTAQGASSARTPTSTDERAVTSTGTAPLKLHEQVVRTFLQSLSPNLEDLTPRFLSAGLVNRTCLLALAGMPDWEKDKLLRDDMSLTAFQSRVVRVGLAGLL
ncbi:uncharacterized protein C8Q71DRAFT_745054 [Rhodofomes roseus]|uniref:Uncharacterized protein n=1 Tax=Rhodofomes roseus TaxID=34475 RepID=A0ABQ8KPT1_9APHY|nr:uncharacterized protein C8Q71DRAFT_745054 [Rhodofomes roseus]KAH9839960.1 hypothetical protein C8Q71DRAFT_745054 [Rhodofomes roseus]